MRLFARIPRPGIVTNGAKSGYNPARFELRDEASIGKTLICSMDREIRGLGTEVLAVPVAWLLGRDEGHDWKCTGMPGTQVWSAPPR